MVLSWPDVEASADWEARGMNLVIHEFAHKIDMRERRRQRLPAAARRHVGRATGGRRSPPRTTISARASIAARTPRSIPTRRRSPAEFFAVLSEVFFADPLLLRDEYPDVYAQFARFYRQDLAARVAAELKPRAPRGHTMQRCSRNRHSAVK